MTETQLLDSTLDLIDETGTGKAYEYLLSCMPGKGERSSQIYNFLYCLAATSGRREEALSWLEEAVLEKDLWYRPEVFEDSDLDMIRSDERFKVCAEVSQQKYREALRNAKPEFSWRGQAEENLIVVLHGNQQNNMISRQFWSRLDIRGYQVEYLQSKEIDSFNLYRWNDDGDGPQQLAAALNRVHHLYRKRILAGFSAGCNTILRAVQSGQRTADRLLLFSPWMPVVKDAGDEIIETLRISGIKVVLICGAKDKESLEHCRVFEEKSRKQGFDFSLRVIENLGHAYPEDPSTWIKMYL